MTPEKLLVKATVEMDYIEWLSALACLDKQKDELMPGSRIHRSVELIIKKIEGQLY